MNSLSHYTNIESLEKILESNSFKFNSLKNMNDPLEGRAVDFKNFANVLFCSSWTKDKSKKGVDYMWDNYTIKGKGIRITLPINPFKEHVLKGERINNEHNIKSILPPRYYDFIVETKIGTMKNLRKVIYDNDIENCFPNVIGGDYLQFYKLGIFKTKKWKKEEEWRYLMTCIPYWIINYTPQTLDEGLSNFTLNEVYIDLKDNIIESMSVLPSKTLSEENLNKLISLSNKYKFKIIN